MGLEKFYWIVVTKLILIFIKADRPLRIKSAQNQFIGLFPDILWKQLG